MGRTKRKLTNQEIFERSASGFLQKDFNELTVEFLTTNKEFFFIKPNELFLQGVAFDMQSLDCLSTVYNALSESNKDKFKNIILKDVYKFAQFLEKMWSLVK